MIGAIRIAVIERTIVEQLRLETDEVRMRTGVERILPRQDNRV